MEAGLRTLRTTDDHAITVRTWQPAQPLAVLQVFHGLAEHSERYARFAARCASEGLAVVAHDHRGHGPSCPPDVLTHFADRDGWNLVIDDAKRVHDDTRQRYATLPVVLLGHSMGSYIAQHFVMQNPHSVVALILSGSTRAPRLQVRIGRWLAWYERFVHGSRYRSERLNALGFGAFNKRFEPARTDFDWLSRDPAEVDKYIADPLCGAPASAGLWYDLLGGLLAIGTARSLQRIPLELPVLVTGGAEDPVGGARGMARLARAFEASGHVQLASKVYAGGRHEMLNETNRDEVMADWLAWISTIVGAASSRE